MLYAGEDFQPAVAEIAERRDSGSVDLLGDRRDPHFWLDPQLMVDAVDDGGRRPGRGGAR